MATLPLEIWREICLILLHEDLRPELLALSRTNRGCYSIAAPFCYRSLTIEFTTVETLQSITSQLSNKGLGKPFLAHARSLSLMPIHEEHSLGIRHNGKSIVQVFNPATNEAFLQPHLTGVPCGGGLSIADRGGNDSVYRQQWEPVISLIARLRHLEEFNFFIQSGFPSSLRKALSKCHPHCKVKIWSSQPAAYAEPNVQRWILPTASETHSKACQIDFEILFWDRLDTFNAEILLTEPPGLVNEMLPFVFAAPNLKHLILTHTFPLAPSLALVEFVERKWRDLAAVSPPAGIANLESLTLSSVYFDDTLFPALATVTDLSCLRSLDISGYMHPDMLADAAKLLKGLERLFVTVDLPHDEDVITAIKTFTPLKFLCLRGHGSAASVLSVLEQHGPSLQGLILELVCYRGVFVGRDGERLQRFHHEYPLFNLSQHNEMAGLCPHLQELRLQVKRPARKTAELEMYRALGQFSSLRSLVLDLHFQPEGSPIGNVFLNDTVDENLARQVWNVITTSQSSQHLMKLRLAPFGDIYFLDDELYYSHHTRSFLLTRGGRDGLSVREIGKVTSDILEQKNRRLLNKENKSPATSRG
ncbi:uncharacterized protein BJX67DRAFT_384118 [Aspergillus lucknowensis]|uniref:F-box domain-containing protein n=1 Tax=Aspergillus lucknowensis TaxID=176173 RepID=A0ABR4LL36_9EURO